MNISEIKSKITELANKHHALEMSLIDEIQAAEFIEAQAIQLIFTYCEENGYEIDGFPTEKRKFIKINEIEEDEYFTLERYELYLDRLTLEKDDVLELNWFYLNNFWPDFYETKEGLLEQIREQLESGSYDCEF